MLLGLDLAFVATGWVVVDPRTFNLLGFGCITTKKEQKRRGIRVADDDFRRCSDLARGLFQVLEGYLVKGIVAEIPTGGAQGARSNRAMGMATGVLSAVVEAYKLPLEVYTPLEVKVAGGGDGRASKESVEVAMLAQWSGLSSFKPKGLRQHVTDAAAVILAARSGVLYRTLGGASEIALKGRKRGLKAVFSPALAL